MSCSNYDRMDCGSIDVAIRIAREQAIGDRLLDALPHVESSLIAHHYLVGYKLRTLWFNVYQQQHVLEKEFESIEEMVERCNRNCRTKFFI